MFLQSVASVLVAFSLVSCAAPGTPGASAASQVFSFGLGGDMPYKILQARQTAVQPEQTAAQPDPPANLWQPLAALGQGHGGPEVGQRVSGATGDRRRTLTGGASRRSQSGLASPRRCGRGIGMPGCATLGLAALGCPVNEPGRPNLFVGDAGFLHDLRVLHEFGLHVVG